MKRCAVKITEAAVKAAFGLPRDTVIQGVEWFPMSQVILIALASDSAPEYREGAELQVVNIEALTRREAT